MAKKKWENYEDVAIYLLNQFASEFGIDNFSGKTDVLGQKSGTYWAIDGKGFNDGEEIFVIVECRRYTNSKQSQEKMGGLAYRIQDTGASGGIIVSPLGLQSGAEKIAVAENIISVKLSSESTNNEYMMEFLNKIKIGFVDAVSSKNVTDSLYIEIYKNGVLIEASEI